MPVVRSAEPSDYSKIAAFDENKSSTDEVISSNECYVAVVDDDIRAFAKCTTWCQYRPYIERLFVHSEHRRQGLDNVLLVYVESICTHEKLWTSTVITNVPMQRLLHKRGYQMAGVIDRLGDVPEISYFKDVSNDES